MRTEMKPTAFCSQRVSHARQESESNTHKHTFLSNNTPLIVVHFRDLVRLRSHQQRTVPDFTWTEPQTTLFKRTLVRFTGAHPRSDDSVHIIQMNRTLTSIEPGCAPKVLVWKHPYSPSSRSKPVWMCLFWTQRKIFWRMRETEQYFSPTMEVNGVPKQPVYKLSSQYLPLCSEQTHSYRFGSTWGWVNDDRIFIFWVHCPFNSCLIVSDSSVMLFWKNTFICIIFHLDVITCSTY